MHNPELELASEYVLHTCSNIFLTGKAGTGKTTFLHNISKQTEKRMVIAAPTGVAAINAGGVTLHSFFQLPFGPYIPGTDPFSGENRHRMSNEKKNIIRSLDLLVIDEISMVRSDLLDLVDFVLRKYRRSNDPFGGVQLLMIGDLHQLSPVVKDSDWKVLGHHYESPYFFSSNALKQTELVPIELKHIYRQSDSSFIELLNRVRDNKLDSQVLDQLNSRYKDNFRPDDDEGYITLSTHNASADALNNEKLAKLNGVSRSYDAELDGDFPEHTYPTAAALQLKPGAQVMFVRNDPTPQKRYFNGKIGTITSMKEKYIEVSCKDDLETITVERAVWENVEYTVNPETAEISQKIIGTFSQYPLKLAWAITIHKSQGLTFDKAIIDAEAAFAHGQVYVALSRCRTFDGMVLSSPLRSSAVKSDHTVNRFVRDAAANCPTEDQLTLSKIRYQQKLLMECFSFEVLRNSINRMSRQLLAHESVIQILGAGNLEEIRQKTNTEIYTVGENFKRQLHGLFSSDKLPGEDPVILERLNKASDYFKEKFSTILMPTIENISIETDNKEIHKRSNNAIKWATEEATVKFAAIQSVATGFSPPEYLRSVSTAEMKATKKKTKPPAVQYSEADVGHPELFEELKAWRRETALEKKVQHFQVMHQKTMVQIAVHLPDSISALKSIKGIGKKMSEMYGEKLVSLVSAYRKKHNIDTVTLPNTPLLQLVESNKEKVEKEEEEKKVPKGKTRDISLELFRKGKNVEEIAAERKLTVPTIENHLTFFIEIGELDVRGLVSDDVVATITEIGKNKPSAPLKEIKEELGDNYSYAEIKFVMAHLRK